MAARKADQPLVCLHAGVAAGGHIGIVCPHQLHAAEVHPLQLPEVGLPTVGLVEVVVHHLGAEKLAQRGVSGIAGIGYQHLIAWIDKRQRDVENAFLAANERKDLGLRVKLYAIPAAVEACHCLPKLRRSHGGLVSVGVRAVRHLAQFLHSLRRRRHVGASYREAYYVLALSVEPCHFLQLAAEVVLAYQAEPVSGLYAIMQIAFHLDTLPIFSAHVSAVL